MIGALTLSVVDRVFIDGVMIGALTLSVVDRVFIDGVMIGALTLSVVDRVFESRSGQIKYHNIDI